jgi:RimJ/RimL family protein N-acetyltransferase
MYVRAARVEDAAAIASVHVRAWQVGYRGIAPDAYLDHISLGERVTMWDEQLASLAADRVVFVAEDQGSVVGFGGGGPPLHGEEGAHQLYVLNVDPAHWGMGAGGAILEAFTAWCVARRARELVLWVAERNARARGFYERRGMTWDGTAEDSDVLGVCIRECRYRKPLAGP